MRSDVQKSQELQEQQHNNSSSLNRKSYEERLGILIMILPKFCKQLALDAPVPLEIKENPFLGHHSCELPTKFLPLASSSMALRI